MNSASFLSYEYGSNYRFSLTSFQTLVVVNTANLPTNMMDLRGFDSSMILIIRGGILRTKGDFPETLSQAILAGIMLVGRLGVPKRTQYDTFSILLFYVIKHSC